MAGARGAGWHSFLPYPSWITLLTALSVATAMLGFVLFAPTPTLYGFVTAVSNFSSLDERTSQLFGRMYGMVSKQKSETLSVAYIGGSTMRESIWSTDAFASDLSELVQKPVAAYDLASSAQSMITSWTLAEKAACNGVQVILLGVNGTRLHSRDNVNPFRIVGEVPPDVASYVSTHPDRRRPTDDVAGKMGFRTALFREAVLVSPTRIPGLWGQRTAPLQGRHQYLNRALSWRPLFSTLRSAATSFRNEYSSRDALIGLAERVAACGARLVIYLAPVRPVLRDPHLFPDAARGLAALPTFLRQALGPEIMMVDPSGAVRLGPDDFYDWGHLRSERAMRGVTRYLAAQIAPVLAARAEAAR